MSVRSSLRLLALIALGTAATACTQATEDPAPGEATAATEAEIVGGKTTTANPAVGAFVDASGPFCTGTLVTKRVIVTAAHCFEDVRAARIAFAIGPNANAPQTLLRVAQLAQHPQYDGQAIRNDIAVAVLAEDAAVTPIPVNEQALDASWVGKSLSFVGYGVTNGWTGAGNGVKRAVSMPIAQVGATQFAYGDRTRNTCFGDSGGPALVDRGNGQLAVVGVTSFGDASCTAFGVDTRVDAFKAFLAPFLAAH